MSGPTTRHSIPRSIVMRQYSGVMMCIALGAFAVFANLARHGFAQDAPSETSTSGPETLARGPIHEAFAEQVNFDPIPGITVTKQPPEPVDEVPPQVQPEGYNVQWIPGYWGWEEDRDDFIWISGVWRDIPPDRQWIPGYWADARDGYQWIAGFWALDSANEVDYLPYPPESLERGPASPQPSASHYWVTGCWQYQDQRYRWRPGYWTVYRDDWLWTPDHYIWTPRGAVYVRGYWDYPLARRGVAFAPVYFNPGYRQRYRNYSYSPNVAINVGNLLFDLFVQPRQHHYYFGDYYGDRYRRAGYQSNFAFHGRSGYDPLFAHHSTQQRRNGVDFGDQVRQWHAARDQDKSARPPRTFNELAVRTVTGQQGAAATGGLLVESLSDMIRNGRSDIRIRESQEQQQQTAARRSTAIRDLVQQRIEAEVQTNSTNGTATPRGRGDARATAQDPKVRNQLGTTLKLLGVKSDLDANLRNGRQRPDVPNAQSRTSTDATTGNADAPARTNGTTTSRAARNGIGPDNTPNQPSPDGRPGRRRGNQSTDPAAPAQAPTSDAPNAPPMPTTPPVAPDNTPVPATPPAAPNSPMPTAPPDNPPPTANDTPPSNGKNSDKAAAKSARSPLNDLLNPAPTPPVRPKTGSTAPIDQQPRNPTSQIIPTPRDSRQDRTNPSRYASPGLNGVFPTRPTGNRQTTTESSRSTHGTNADRIRPSSPAATRSRSVQPSPNAQPNSAATPNSSPKVNRGTSSTFFNQLRSRSQTTASTRSSASPTRRPQRTPQFVPQSRARDDDDGRR